MAMSGDGRRLVSGSYDRTVRVWDTSNGQGIHCLRGHEYGVHCVAVSNDGRRVVSGSLDSTARVWDTTSGQEFACLRGHEWVNSVAWSGDGCRIVSGSKDKTVRVWDATNLISRTLSRDHGAFPSMSSRIKPWRWWFK
jgi:WD40 repeat protein